MKTNRVLKEISDFCKFIVGYNCAIILLLGRLRKWSDQTDTIFHMKGLGYVSIKLSLLYIQED